MRAGLVFCDIGKGVRLFRWIVTTSLSQANATVLRLVFVAIHMTHSSSPAVMKARRLDRVHEYAPGDRRRL